MAKKDEADPEDIRKATNDLQQASLKLFEMAYRKVRYEVGMIDTITGYFHSEINNVCSTDSDATRKRI